MAIVAEAGIKQRIWRGYDDPGLPVGMWVGWVGVTGDVSGGTMTALMEFEPSELLPNRRPGRFYNIEALECTFTSEAANPAELLLINWSVAVDGAQTNRSWTLPMLSNEGGNSALGISNQLHKPIFLGQPAIRGVTASVRAILDNDNGTTLVLWAEGYIWEGRSTQSEGGLRRPVDSLYGA